MRLLDQVAVLILTYNEAPNIGRTLDALVAFSEIVVLDSGSTDETLKIVARYPNVRIRSRTFDQHATQWNYGLTQCGIERPWVLALDADFILSSAIVKEIASLSAEPLIGGYRASFQYCVFGRRLRAALYPPLTVLYRRERARYRQDGHTQRLVVEGEIGVLRGRIYHDDRKSLSRWLSSQQKYSRLEAEHLFSKKRSELRSVDHIRLMGWPAPIAIFLYTLIWKGCVLDGWHGWFYVLQRTLAEAMIALEIVDRRIRVASASDCSKVGS